MGTGKRGSEGRKEMEGRTEKREARKCLIVVPYPRSDPDRATAHKTIVSIAVAGAEASSTSTPYKPSLNLCNASFSCSCLFHHLYSPSYGRNTNVKQTFDSYIAYKFIYVFYEQSMIRQYSSG